MIDTFDYSTMPSYLHDAELSDETIGRALSSPLFIQEREKPAGRRQAHHSFEESVLPSQSLSVCHVRKGRPVHELSSLGSSSREKPSRDSENEQIRILLERQKKQTLAEVRTEIQKHEFQAESDRRSIQELTGIIDSPRMKIDHTITRCEQFRRDQLLPQEEISEQNRDFRETCIRNMRDMKELQKRHVLCRQITPHTNLFLEHFHFAHTPHCGSRCLWCAFTPSACHP